MTHPRTSFERYELKYWIPDSLARELVELARPYMKPDVYGGVFVQKNSSLYFDTRDYDFFHNHLASQPDRFKLRVRAYGDPPSGVAFFEVKRKVKGVIVKRRAGVPLEQVRALLEGDHAPLERLRPGDRSIMEGFLYLREVHRAEPVVMVVCEREAWASQDPFEDVRFTVDREIAYQPARDLDFHLDERAWVSLDTYEQTGSHEPRVMLELKFCDHAPLWMEEVVQRLGMPRIAHSKYVNAVASELALRGLERDWTARSA